MEVLKRCLVLLALVAAAASAEDLVPRVLAVEWSGEGGPPAAFTAEVLRTELAQQGTFLVAANPEVADAVLTLTLSGTNRLLVSFRDGLDPGRDWNLALPVAATNTKALREALATLAPRWREALAPVPPKVREVYTETIVQQTVFTKVQRGVTVTLVGRPGTVVRFTDGRTQTLVETELVLADQVQDSVLAIDATLPGAYDRHVEVVIGHTDVRADVTVTDTPLWGLALGFGGREFWHATLARRLGTGPWHLVGTLTTPWPLTVNYEPLSVVPSSFAQLEAGVLWYGSRPGDFLEWGLETQATLRFDSVPNGWLVSNRFPVGLRGSVVGGIRLGRSWSLDVKAGGWLVASGQDLEQLGFTSVVSGLYSEHGFGWFEVRYWF